MSLKLNLVTQHFRGPIPCLGVGMFPLTSIFTEHWTDITSKLDTPAGTATLFHSAFCFVVLCAFC